MSRRLDALLAQLARWIDTELAGDLLEAGLILAGGWLLHVLVRRAIRWRWRRSPQAALLRSLATVLILSVSVALALRAIGFDLGVLLGAAGVLTVALGFASQTSASNLISGLFLLFERPFRVGDVITVDGTTGEVMSIDLLSVRMRSFDNLMVRIPNENMLKSKVINQTYFPIRRMDFNLTLAHSTDVERARDCLYAVAEHDPRCLVEPKPVYFFELFGPAGVELQFSAWTSRDDFYPVRTELFVGIKRALEAAGIAIAQPRRQVELVGENFPPLPRP